MNWKRFGGAGKITAKTAGENRGNGRGEYRRRARRGFGWLVVLATFCWWPLTLQAQDTAAVAATNTIAGTPAQQVAALQLELTNAWQQVIRIVNQPVRAFARSENTPASVYSPGWFHEGASIPDFNTVDVRKTQELTYAGQEYVTSDLNPTMVFLGQELEFNSMTKLFYVNRSLPKHRLNEAEMLEINRLYRIIGHCQSEILRLQPPPEAETAVASPDDTNGAPPAPTGLVGNIQRIPREKRILYGGMAIGVLIVVVVAGRVLKGRAG